jgi:mRNA interferase MazF
MLDGWDVIVVPFPYSEKLAEKRRPALVVSGERLNREGFLWIAMITGAAKDKRIGDVLIRDLALAGLPGPSMVRSSKLATIEPSRVLRRVGRLAESERAAILDSITTLLVQYPSD